MELSKLIELSNKGYLRQDLGDGWEYIKRNDGFIIHYNNMLGGIRVEIKKHDWLDDELFVYRIFNDNKEEIYNEYDNKEHDIDLQELHYGVNEKLKHLFGF